MSWTTTVASVLLLIFAANQFSTEWAMFRSSSASLSGGDFPHYYLAAKIAGTPGKHRLYYSAQSSKEETLGKIDPNTEWGREARQNGIPDTLYFSAPPFVATLLTPIGRLSFKTAFFVWRILSELFFFLAVVIILQVCRALTPITLLVCTMAGFFFEPFVLTLDKGQFGALLLLLWSAGTLLAQKKWDPLSSLMFALATLVKLTPVLVLGLFLIRRRWKWVGFYLLWLVLLIAVSFWQTGLENQQLFLSKMKVLACGVPGPYNYSLPGIIQNVYYGNILAYEQMPAQAPAWLCFSGKALAVVLLAGALLILIRRNRGGDVAWDLIVLALVTLLIAPFTWRHYYTLEILPLIFVWFSLRRGRFSNLNAVRWTAIICTFVAATRYPDYLQVHLTNGPARVFLVSLLALSALALTIVLLFAYRDEVPPEKVGLMA
jgi:hypothetical protein